MSMDPTSQPTPSFEMPTSTHQGEAQAITPESAPFLERAPAPQQLAPPLMPPLPLINPTPIIPGSPQPPVASPMTSPAIADDIDLIEKEWVDKAKAIVNATRSDPHSQNKEMNRFKADYMKKRYNKDIKVPEGS